MPFTKFTNSESHEVIDPDRAAKLSQTLRSEETEDEKRQRIAKILEESK